MRFLITCYRLDLSGSSSYTYTLASELKKRRYKVDIFTPFPEIVVNKLKEKNISIYRNPKDLIDKKYSCIIVQHNILALIMRSIKPDVPMVFISHGVLIPQAFLEQPPSIDINIQKYIAISEEVKQNLIENHKISQNKINLIRNFVDPDRFYPRVGINKEPKKLLFISNRFNREVYQVIKNACRKCRLKLDVIGSKTRQVFNIEDFINKADIVISLGRGALEAMACGRAVIVYDYQGGEGIITKKNIEEIKKCNFSGRRFAKKYTVDDLVKEIKKYKKEMGKVNRKIVLKDYNVKLATDEILKTCKEAEETFQFKKIPVPHKELLWFLEELNKIYNSKAWKGINKIYEMKNWISYIWKK